MDPTSQRPDPAETSHVPETAHAAEIAHAAEAARATGSLVQATVALWVRYLVPLTVLSAIALAPVVGLALRVRPPNDPAGADAVLASAWGLVAVAWIGQLVLVGGAAGVARSQRSQLRALGAGLGQLGHAIVPCLAAVVAIGLGGLALAVPGLALVGLLALTGASRARGVAALADSLAVARRHARPVVLTVAAMIALDVAIVAIAQHVIVVPLSRPPRPAELAALPHFVRVAALALVAGAPLPAAALALIRIRAAG